MKRKRKNKLLPLDLPNPPLMANSNAPETLDPPTEPSPLLLRRRRLPLSPSSAATDSADDSSAETISDAAAAAAAAGNGDDRGGAGAGREGAGTVVNGGVGEAPVGGGGAQGVFLYRASAPAHRRVKESPLSSDAIFKQVRGFLLNVAV